MAKKARKPRKSRGKKMPHGITVLRRNGSGKDIIEGDADEIAVAVKLYRTYLPKRLRK